MVFKSGEYYEASKLRKNSQRHVETGATQIKYLKLIERYA
jgi:hypothetical protein